jgi:hypothetical protein
MTLTSDIDAYHVEVDSYEDYHSPNKYDSSISPLSLPLSSFYSHMPFGSLTLRLEDSTSHTRQSNRSYIHRRNGMEQVRLQYVTIFA